MNISSSRWLLAAALLSFGIALLHLAIIFAGPGAYAWFGAPALGAAEAAGAAYPDVVTAGLVVVFALFGVYALAGAGRVRRPPLLPLGLALVGAVFTLRGLVIIPEAIQLARGPAGYPPRYAAFSLVSLATGICFLAGTLPRWKALRAARSPAI